MDWKKGLLAVLLAAALPVSCREVPPPADLIIRGARLVQGEARGPVDLAIDGDRITALEPAPMERSGRREIEASGNFLLPGLIDVHVHLLVSPEVTDETSLARQRKQVTGPNLESFLRHGVTTVRSTGDPLLPILALRQEIESGSRPGPRLLVTGPVLSAPEGHPEVTVFAGNPFLQQRASRALDSREKALEALAGLARLGVDGVKIVYQGSDDPESTYLYAEKVPIRRMSRPVMEAVVEEAHRLGLRVTAHTFEEEGVEAVIEAGIDSIEHGVLASTPVSSALVRLLLDRNLVYVPTLQVFATRSRPEVLHNAMANLGQLAAAGVRVALGTDTVPSHPAGLNTIREIQRMAEAGMSPARVLESATREAARLLGREEDLGSLEPGKLADLILVKGDPRTDLARLERPPVVIQGGRVVVDRRTGQ